MSGCQQVKKSLPARYKGLPEVGNPMSPDMEIIQSLQPTDVLSVTTLQYDLETPFQQAGVPATYLNLESMADMEKAITKLGDQYDRKKQAERIVSEFEQKKKDIQERTKGKRKPSVLILLGVPGRQLFGGDREFIYW
ncbi:hypothetical protein BsIDN1_68270 [Bacillus safensis]|uniref:Fe/B12 periplasmic-binding domain-containing protein n=1 Tax=Bacillus safensis TaxID=561879 RepID=A0A5S9MMH4_BACIA|nr:hypothetical protein BsIDN1_68270 [Bacillus safensis]